MYTFAFSTSLCMRNQILYNLINNTFFKAKVWQNALHKISFNICMSWERSETFLKVLVLQKKCWNEKIKLKRKINSCKVQLSLTSFYHCQFQLSTLQRGKKLIVEQLFIYFCVFFSSLWIQLFFGQIFINYIFSVLTFSYHFEHEILFL